MITYSEDEVKTLIKAFHLDSVEGKYGKDLLDWCNKWLSENLYKKPIVRIFESVQHKMPENTSRDYKILDKPYNTWDDFFDEHAESRRSGEGIDQRYLGYAGDVTVFWKSEEEYPFAYVFPKSINEKFESGYFFYIKKTGA